MPDRTLNLGDPADAATKYRLRDDDPAGGGNLVLAEDLDGNTVLLQWNPTAGQWEYGGPVDLGGNDLTGVGSATVNALEADATLVGATQQDGDMSFGDWETNNHEAIKRFELSLQTETDGSSNAKIDVEIDYSGGTTPDKTIIGSFTPSGLNDGNQLVNFVSVLLPPGASIRVVNDLDPNAANQFRLENEWLL